LRGIGSGLRALPVLADAAVDAAAEVFDRPGERGASPARAGR
jgi:hypothetical protein